MYISLLLKMINGFSSPAKFMASPFNILPGDHSYSKVDNDGRTWTYKMDPKQVFPSIKKHTPKQVYFCLLLLPQMSK